MKKLLKLAGFYMLSKPTNMSTFIPVTTSSSSDRKVQQIVKVCSKFTGEHPCWNAVSSVNLLHIFRTPYPKNISGGLLLQSWKNYETNCSFHVKLCRARKLYFLFFSSFLLLTTIKISLSSEERLGTRL